MRKRMFLVALMVMMVFGLTACGRVAFEDKALNVPAIALSSASITEDGQLLTACAADKSPNDPMGQNQSPALRWDAVEGAASYTVVMFDEDANWLHWMVSDVTETELPQGAYTAHDFYIGPYPPKSAGQHRYRIEVFAVRQAPDEISGKMDAVNSYAELVSSIDNTGIVRKGGVQRIGNDLIKNPI